MRYIVNRSRASKEKKGRTCTRSPGVLKDRSMGCKLWRNRDGMGWEKVSGGGNEIIQKPNFLHN